MSNVGKFLFDLCNEFSINILLLKLAADSCGTPAHRGHTHTHTHSGTHTHTHVPSSSIYFYGNAFSLQVDCALVSGLGHVQMRFTVVCLPSHTASWQGRNPGSSFRQMADRKCTFAHCQRQLWRGTLWRHFEHDFKHAGLKARRDPLRYAHVHTSHSGRKGRRGAWTSHVWLGKLFIIPSSVSFDSFKLPKLIELADPLDHLHGRLRYWHFHWIMLWYEISRMCSAMP